MAIKIPGYDGDGWAQAASLWHGNEDEEGRAVGPNHPLPVAIKSVADDDLIFDAANSVRMEVQTTSLRMYKNKNVSVRFVRIYSTVDIFFRNDGLHAGDAAGSCILKAGTSENIPVVYDWPLYACAITTPGVVYITPLIPHSMFVPPETIPTDDED
jgi:hypothetical protein